MGDPGVRGGEPPGFLRVVLRTESLGFQPEQPNITGRQRALPSALALRVLRETPRGRAGAWTLPRGEGAGPTGRGRGRRRAEPGFPCAWLPLAWA